MCLTGTEGSGGGPCGAPLFRAIAKWDRGSWFVRIEGPDGSVAGGTVATGLDRVEAKAREILAADGGATKIAVVVDPLMPLDTAQRFQLAEDLVRDAEAEIEDAQRELLALDWPATDVEWVSRQHRLTPGPRLITITNEALATVGLDEHPEVLGVRWQDHGRFQTITCRSCVEQNRAAYRDAPPDELNELIRVASPDLYCDHCKSDLAMKTDLPPSDP